MSDMELVNQLIQTVEANKALENVGKILEEESQQADHLTLTLTQNGQNLTLTSMVCSGCGFSEIDPSGIDLLTLDRLEVVGGDLVCPRCDNAFLSVDYTVVLNG